MDTKEYSPGSESLFLKTAADRAEFSSKQLMVRDGAIGFFRGYNATFVRVAYQATQGTFGGHENLKGSRGFRRVFQGPPRGIL